MSMLLHSFLYIDTFLTKTLTCTRTLLPVKICHTISSSSHTLLLWCAWLSALLSWLVCAPGRELSTRPSVRLVVRVSKCQKPPNLCLIYTLKKYICLAIFPFSLYPSFSLSISLSFVSTLSVWQGSTESCNNTEEEEMKGRKGTCPTFTYSACLFLFTLYIFVHFIQVLSLCWSDREIYVFTLYLR